MGSFEQSKAASPYTVLTITLKFTAFTSPHIESGNGQQTARTVNDVGVLLETHPSILGGKLLDETDFE